MYNDYYLKFADESAMLEVINEDTICPGCFVDIIGLIVDVPATVDDEGQITQEATFVGGWHVNVRIAGELPEALSAYEIGTPATPARVWA